MGSVHIEVVIHPSRVIGRARMRLEAVPNYLECTADLAITIKGAKWQVIEELEALRDYNLCPIVADAAARKLVELEH